MSGLEAVIAVPWVAMAAIVGGAVRKLVRDCRPATYAGRHRALLLSTAEQVAAAVAIRQCDEAPTVPIPVTVIGHGRGLRLPVPTQRSVWGSPEWVDDWTAEHDLVVVAT